MKVSITTLGLMDLIMMLSMPILRIKFYCQYAATFSYWYAECPYTEGYILLLLY